MSDQIKKITQQDFQIPFVIGVVGHRNIEPEKCSPVSSEIERIIVKQLGSFPNTPIIVLSSLAKGADTLAADVVLKLKDEYADRIRLYAPLPLEQDLYEADFNDDDVERFKDLVCLVDQCFELDPHLDWEGADKGELNNIDSIERKRQYAQVGAFIAHHANMLIAIYDGNSANNIGGTKFSLDYMLDRKLDSANLPECLKQKNLINLGEPGIVYQIDPNPNSGNKPTIVKKYSAHDSLCKKIKENYELLQKDLEQHNAFVKEDFFKDKEELDVATEANFRNSKGYLFSEKEARCPDRSEKIDFIRTLFAFFDSNANHAKKKEDRNHWINLAMLFITFFCYEFYTNAEGGGLGTISEQIGFASFVVFFIFLLLFNIYVGRKRDARNFVKFRGAAEILRAKTALMYFSSKKNIFGLTKYVDKEYMDFYDNLLMTIELDYYAKGYTKKETNINEKLALLDVNKLLVKDQLAYSLGNSLKIKKRSDTRLKDIYKISMLFALIVLTASIWFQWYYDTTVSLLPTTKDNLDEGLIKTINWITSVLIALGFAVAVAVYRIRVIRGHKEDLSQNEIFKHMYQNFQSQTFDYSTANEYRSLKEELKEESSLQALLKKAEGDLKNRQKSEQKKYPEAAIKKYKLDEDCKKIQEKYERDTEEKRNDTAIVLTTKENLVIIMAVFKSLFHDNFKTLAEVKKEDKKKGITLTEQEKLQLAIDIDKNYKEDFSSYAKAKHLCDHLVSSKTINPLEKLEVLYDFIQDEIQYINLTNKDKQFLDDYKEQLAHLISKVIAVQMMWITHHMSSEIDELGLFSSLSRFKR